MQGLSAPILKPESELPADALASVVVLRDPANQVTRCGDPVSALFSLDVRGPYECWAASSRGRLGARRHALTLGWRQSSATPTPHAWESKPVLPSASEGEHRRHRTSSRSRNPGSGVPPHQHRLLGSNCERASHADGTAGISCAAASGIAKSSETACPASLLLTREPRTACWTVYPPSLTTSRAACTLAINACQCF